MSTHSKDTKSKLWQRLGAYFSSSHKEEEAQARIQAFLSAFPGEYCGWDKDGQAAYSSGFCKILGIERVKSLSDVQSKLAPSDSAALEGVFEHLEEKGQSFEIYVHTYESGKILKVTGSQGRDPDGREKYNVIWIEGQYIKSKILGKDLVIKKKCLKKSPYILSKFIFIPCNF